MLVEWAALAVGFGRRYRKKVAGVAHPYGSSTATTVYSAPAGARLVKRTSALLVISEKAAARASAVEMSLSGQTLASTRLKSGSRPAEASNKRCAVRGLIAHPSSGLWQVAQVRGFVPSGWKNGLVKSTAPVVWNVSAVPALLPEASRGAVEELVESRAWPFPHPTATKHIKD